MKKLFLIFTTAMLLSIAGYSQTTCPPSIPQFNFNIIKPVIENQKVGGVSYCEPDLNQTDTWSILENQTLWKIMPNGDILVNDPIAVNTGVTATYVFTVQIIDNGLPPLANVAEIILHVTNTQPVILSQ